VQENLQNCLEMMMTESNGAHVTHQFILYVGAGNWKGLFAEYHYHHHHHYHHQSDTILRDVGLQCNALQDHGAIGLYKSVKIH